RPIDQVLSEASVEIDVADTGRSARVSDPAAPTPCRITVVNRDGALMTVGARSNDHLAVRPGVVYTSTGQARFGLPAGEYTIYAGRGFDYGLDSTTIQVKAGDMLKKSLAIRREVPLEGYVSCDTHIHTLTYSGHGDA